MAWIESHTVLIRHRKLIELARELRLKPVHVLGHLHVLWHVALEQQEDGDLSSWSDDLIASFSCYSGDAPQYVRLLQKHGWLNGKLLHDWLDYAGLYLIKKYSSSRRQVLIEIWKKHGREYGDDLLIINSRSVTSPDQDGERTVNKKRTNGERKVNLPYLPNQPDLTEPTKTPLPPLKGGRSFSEDQKQTIKSLLASKLNHGIDSEANEQAFKELEHSILSNPDIKNPMGVAIHRASKGYEEWKKTGK